MGTTQKREFAPERREAENLPLNDQSMEQEFIDLDMYQPVVNGYKVIFKHFLNYFEFNMIPS